MTTAPDVIIRLDAVHRTYGDGAAESRGLTDLSLDLERGRRVAVVGPSGCGKSTLLNLIGAMDRPTAGRVVVDGRDLGALNDRETAAYRATTVGFVFQLFNLVPALNVLDNVALPARLAGVRAGNARRRSRALLERVGLGDRGADGPEMLSGGEQQRVALARALVNEPAIVLADEPTGALDEATGERVLSLLHEVVRERGATLVMATHSDAVVTGADRVIRLVDGRLAADERRGVSVS